MNTCGQGVSSASLDGISPAKDAGLLFLLLVFAVFARIVLALVTGYTSDDAFITYRYAAHLAGGEGLTYNPGERVQGSSTPLFTLLLGAAALALGAESLPFASKTLSLFADVMSLILLWKLLSDMIPLARFTAVALFGLYPKTVLIGISGMEASVVVFLMLAVLFLLRRNNMAMAAIAAGALVFTRVDSIPWILLCGVWVMAKGEGRFWRTALLVPLIAVPWFVFASLYFGSAVPHAVVAKSVSWSHMFPAFDPLRVLLGYLPFQGLERFSSVVQTVAVVLFIGPVVVEVLLSVRKTDGRIIFPVFFLVYNLLFSFGQVVMADWYYLPGYLAYAATLGSILDRAVRRAGSDRWQMRAGGLPNIILVVTLLVLLGAGASRWADNPGGLFLRQNRALGIWLGEHAPSVAGVLVEPIGYIGWESGLYIHDYIGLVSPEILTYRRRYPGSDAWFMRYVMEKTPEYIVLRNWEVPQNRLFHGFGDGIFRSDEEREWFDAHYRLIPWDPFAAERDSVYLVVYEFAQWTDNINLASAR